MTEIRERDNRMTDEQSDLAGVAERLAYVPVKVAAAVSWIGWNLAGLGPVPVIRILVWSEGTVRITAADTDLARATRCLLLLSVSFLVESTIRTVERSPALAGGGGTGREKPAGIWFWVAGCWWGAAACTAVGFVAYSAPEVIAWILTPTAGVVLCRWSDGDDGTGTGDPLTVRAGRRLVVYSRVLPARALP